MLRFHILSPRVRFLLSRTVYILYRFGWLMRRLEHVKVELIFEVNPRLDD
jgi:hypothetical protein